MSALPAPESVLARTGLGAVLKAVVGGSDVAGTGPEQVVIDPATGRRLAVFHDAGDDLVSRAVASAAAARRAWGVNDGTRRAGLLLRIAQLVRQRAADLAAAESLDSGKPLNQARADVETAARYFEFYAGIADKIYGESLEQPTGFAYTRREPYGVVAVITPWNSPIAQMSRSVAPALAAGNTVVVKPSELTPLTSILLGRLMLAAGLPAGVCNVIPGAGPSAGSALVRHPDVSFVSFTGSVQTGRAVSRAAGDRIVATNLELGGKSATLVFPDADLAAAARAGVAAVVRNAGQSCFACTRLVAHRSIHDHLIELMSRQLAKLTIGPGLGSPDLGPLVSAGQRDRARGFIDRAVADGATVANDVGGDVPPEGFFLRPHLVVNVRNEMEIAQQEVFGPVQSVIAVDDEDEAVAVANASRYGLAAGIFTSSLDRAHRCAHRLEAGQVQINRFPAGGVDTPFGGYKQSGLGREKGVEALRHYTQLKTIIVELGDGDG
ncbi:MAG TPA: aldehyde dehydrogenase family protein [Streptosporangiaceae bacterium]|nr:aldehyde dehydrogenase family protein [Streptosporangiaceae bacterium]